jgi:hypothetical protein
MMAADVRAGADEESVQPGIEPLDVAQGRQVAPRADNGFLGRILRKLRVAEEQASDPVQPIDGAGGQNGEGFAVSPSRPVHDFRLHAWLPSEMTDLVVYPQWRRRGLRGSNSPSHSSSHPSST